MSERKVKVNGALTAFAFDKSKKYKYNTSGDLVEATTVADNDIIMSGSKSSLRRIGDLERNVSILATQLTTTDGDSIDENGSVAYADKAGKWKTARTLSLSGAVTGSVSIDGSGNVSLSTTATADPTLTLTGDVSGSATFTNLGNATLSVTIADDSHNHTIANIDGLQTALNAKATPADITAAINGLVAGAPAALDTLNELAAAIGDNASYAASVTSAISGKVSTGSSEYVKSASTSNDTITFTRGDNTTFAVSIADANTTYSAGTGIGLSGTSFSVAAGNGLSQTATGLQMSGSYTGSFTATGDITAYSDDRLKTDVETIGGALDKVSRVRGVNFTRKEDGSRSTGVVAQELAAVLPEAVKTDENGMHHVAYGNITGLLIEAVKELKDEIDYLKGLK